MNKIEQLNNQLELDMKLEELKAELELVQMENEQLKQNPRVIVITKETSYTPAQKRAISKYQSKNKEKINDIASDYYHRNRQNPEFLQRKNELARKYYENKKLKKLQEQLQVLL